MSNPRILEEIDQLVTELETSVEDAGASVVRLRDSARANAESAAEFVAVLEDAVEHARQYLLHASAAT